MNAMLLPLRLPFFIIGILAVFSAERYVTEESTRGGLLVAAWVLLILALILTILRQRKARHRDFGNEVIAWRWIIAWKALVLLGLGIYFLRTVLPPLAGIWQQLWIASWISAVAIGLAWGIGLEVAHVRSGRGAFAEPLLVSSSGKAWVSMSLLALGLMGFNFYMAKQDRVYDLSYFKTAKASASTEAMLAQLQKDIRVGLFFAKDSEVLPAVRSYMEALASKQSHLKLEVYDKDFSPVQAEEFRVSRNGQIVLMDGERRQRIDLGDKQEHARKKLATLDGIFQKELLALSSEALNIYFSDTHGEMGWEAGKHAQLKSLKSLETLLRNQNFRPRKQGAAFTGIPEDAAVVAIMGPVVGLTKEDITAIQAFLERGGRLLIALDLDKGDERSSTLVNPGQDELYALIKTFGIEFLPVPLTNDKDFVTSTRQKSDRLFVYTNVFGSHPAVSTLSRNDEKLNIISFQSGALSLQEGPSEWKPTATVMSLKNSFLDLNRNLEWDPNEVRKSYPIAAAAEKKMASGKIAKVLVFADSSQFSDPLFQVTGNQWVALDGIRWLVDRNELGGVADSEEDVFIRHSHLRELWLFVASIFLVPSLVLALGFFMTRGNRRPA